ncbi:MAG: amine oxidase [Ginsengibacter sp.]
MRNNQQFHLSHFIKQNSNPFESFWMAGYECADMLNAHGERVDMAKITGHLHRVNEDYDLLKIFNIKTVREGIRWSRIESAAYEYDWNEFIKMKRIGLEHGIQQIWDLCHFGFPHGLSPLDTDFETRFTDLCRSFVRIFRQVDATSPILVIPINEISFISWLGGDQAGTVPYRRDVGWKVKYELVKASISGIRAMKDLDNNLLVLTTEPLMNVVPPVDVQPDQLLRAAQVNEYQFQVTDMLEGRFCSELGGNPHLIDIQGLNYYYNNQWILDSFQFLPWANESNDARWKPVSSLILDFYKRYEKPVILSETSHPKEHRPDWLRFIARECSLLKDIPFWGVCWYPIIDRPDWDNLSVLHHSGVWEVNDEGTRLLYQPLAIELEKLARQRNE